MPHNLVCREERRTDGCLLDLKAEPRREKKARQDRNRVIEIVGLLEESMNVFVADEVQTKERVHGPLCILLRHLSGELEELHFYRANEDRLLNQVDGSETGREYLAVRFVRNAAPLLHVEEDRPFVLGFLHQIKCLGLPEDGFENRIELAGN